MRAGWLRADESLEEVRSSDRGCCRRSWLTDSFEGCPIGSDPCNRKDSNVLEAATFTAPQPDIPHAQSVGRELRNVLRYAQLVPKTICRADGAGEEVAAGSDSPTTHSGIDRRLLHFNARE